VDECKPLDDGMTVRPHADDDEHGGVHGAPLHGERGGGGGNDADLSSASSAYMALLEVRLGATSSTMKLTRPRHVIHQRVCNSPVTSSTT